MYNSVKYNLIFIEKVVGFIVRPISVWKFCFCPSIRDNHLGLREIIGVWPLQFPLYLLYDSLEASSSSCFQLEWEIIPVTFWFYNVTFLQLLDPSKGRTAWVLEWGQEGLSQDRIGKSLTMAQRSECNQD